MKAMATGSDSAFAPVETAPPLLMVHWLLVAEPALPGVTLPRRESKQGRGHKGFEIRGDPFMTFPEAARRRDFTVNAIGWDPLTEAYDDPFDGRGGDYSHTHSIWVAPG